MLPSVNVGFLLTNNETDNPGFGLDLLGIGAIEMKSDLICFSRCDESQCCSVTNNHFSNYLIYVPIIFSGIFC